MGRLVEHYCEEGLQGSWCIQTIVWSVMFVKFDNGFFYYPPPANHYYVGDTSSCKYAPRLVEKWIAKHHKPEGYYGWVCLKWEEHLNLLYIFRSDIRARVNDDKIQGDWN